MAVPSAGEVEQFAYCAHNWFLARMAKDPVGEAARQGIERHEGLGMVQTRVEAEKRDYRDAVRWSIRLLAVATSATVLALEVVFLRAHPLHWVFLTTALVLVNMSVALTILAEIAQRRYRHDQRKAGIVPGRLVDSDLMAEAELLQDPDWGISGRPDYVLETKTGKVPVEVKTGRTPRRPHRSHVLQLACYLRLLQARDGKAPAYGLLTYPEGSFRVPWDQATQADLKQILQRMAEALETGTADRDHDHVARCRGCARRNLCDQRLDARAPR